VRTRITTPPQSYDPQWIGPYEVLGRLGAGAMGQVYLARSRSSRLVAVKTIRADLAADVGYRQRFADEAAAARRVSGAFTAAVVDADPEADLPWLATVYLPAPSLADLVRVCGPLPVRAVRWLAAGCAEALESIHRVGLVHRDLKPGNVLVDADGPKVIDFGLARVDDNPHRTGGGTVMGTPSFMAPEQATGEHEVGPASDMFCLGATLLFAATGLPPYRAKNSTEAIFMLMTGEKPDLTDIPEGLSELLLDCLSRDPGNRPTPAELLERCAPYLSVAEAGPALPSTALELINEYRRDPNTQSLIHERSGDADSGMERALLPTHPSFPLGSPLAPHTPHRGLRRRTYWTVPIAATVAVLAVGIAAGAYYGLQNNTPEHVPGAGSSQGPGSGPGQGQGQGQGLGPGPDQGTPGPGGYGPPPPGGGGLQPPPGAVWQVDGVLFSVAPPFGSPAADFDLYGSGWPPNAKVTVSLVGGRTAAVGPVADSSGTFNYLIDQSNGLFTGAIPPGTYHVTATYGSVVATVTFSVADGPPTPTPS